MNKTTKANHARNENRKPTADDFSERVDYKKTTLSKLLTEAIAKYNEGKYPEAEYLFGVARPHWKRLVEFNGWTDHFTSNWLSDLAKLSQYKPNSWELKDNTPVVPYRYEFEKLVELHSDFLKRRFAEVITSRKRLDALCQKYGIPEIINADVSAYTSDDKAKAIWGKREFAIRSEVLVSGNYKTHIGTVDNGVVPVVVELSVAGVGTIKANVKGFKIADERRWSTFKCERSFGGPSWNIVESAFNKAVKDYLPENQRKELLGKVKTRSLRDHRYSILEEIIKCEQWKHLQENDFPKLGIVLAELKTRLAKESFVPATKEERRELHHEAYGKYVSVPSRRNPWYHWNLNALSEEEHKTYLRGNCSPLELSQAIQTESTGFVFELLQLYLDNCEQVAGYIQGVSRQKLEPPKDNREKMTILRYSIGSASYDNWPGNPGYEQPKDLITDAEHTAIEEQINQFITELWPLVKEVRDLNDGLSPQEKTEPKQGGKENVSDSKNHWYYAYDPTNTSPSMMDQEVKSIPSAAKLPAGKKLFLVCSIQEIAQVDTSNIHALDLFNADNEEQSPLTDDDLANLPALPQLEVFKLSPRSCITAKGVATIVERSPSVKVLDVTVSNVSNECLQSIAGLKNLESLNLHSDGTLGKDNFGDLTQLSPLKNLRKLWLWDCSLTDSNLEAFTALPAVEDVYIKMPYRHSGVTTLPQSQTLRKLYLDWKNLDDSFGESLQGLPNIEELHLGSTKVGNAFLQQLKGREQLTALTLYRTKITGDGLDQLGLLPNLKDLDIRHTQVTDADIERCLPNFPKLEKIALCGPVDELVPAFLVSKRIKACVQGPFFRDSSCDCPTCKPLNEKENAEFQRKWEEELKRERELA